jgi:hypothetical protein
MHRLYLESEFVVNTNPAKLSMYRHLFLTEFNLAFHHPKKDRCDACEGYKNILQPSKEQKINYDSHILRKLAGKIERDRDRANHNKASDSTTMVICFDMQKVISLPQAEISSFFISGS